MSNKIFIITVFISNIAFGSVLPKIDLQRVVNTKSTNKLTTKISTQLFNRGLEKHIAKAKVKNSLMHDDELNAIMAHNIVKTLKTVNEKDIVDFLAQSALRGKKVDLSSYSTLIALVQKSSQALLDKETLFHIEKVSLENESLKAMRVVS
ncbi:hypothetical protein [Sulfurimonas autotrophica]|uniref:Uncharacterized protein n=1 Tax=Sulfurimonas autotrophica (strain ATCC BAA-671 / DSM 16294 / JCM 11897 / OK10) TaxID=563040 RepID=E0UQ29_SULAO|nr:hypothetical protein [Sulfurimonas autotrophica]ADN08704.1 conserved hypothetical protein [Sulfurimonas autotrophica DSM 16294]